MFFCSNNVLPDEYILDMNYVDETITQVVRYNARIWCHYITWYPKIRLYSMNKIINCFTWMKCFTHIFHNLTKAGILKICNGNTVKNGMPCLELRLYLLIKNKCKLEYFLVANWDIVKAVYKCGQESMDIIRQHMMHMCIHDTIIYKMLEWI